MSAIEHFPQPNAVFRDTLKYRSYVDILQNHALAFPLDHGLSELHGLKEIRRSYNYAQMDRRCRAIAAHLQSLGAKGERALLAFDNDPDYLLTFLACAYAGVIAVPVYAPTQRNHAERFVTIAADCDAKFLLSTNAIVARNKRLGLTGHDFPDLEWVLVDEIDDIQASHWQPHAPAGDDIAYLQYTSGSTGTPRGVMVSHANLVYQGAYIEFACELHRKDKALSWLPLYHDMGLIVGALQAVYTGFPLLLTTPNTVVMHPDRWLKAIASHRITFAGSPNFVYDLCVDSVDPATLEGVDLSCWSVAFNAAEPIRASTLERFAKTFAPLGLPATTPHPAYGLAEATLSVTMKIRDTPAITRSVCTEALKEDRILDAIHPDQTRTLVSSGRFVPDTQVRIVNPGTLKSCALEHIGEIWVSGSGPAQGYWGQPEESQEIFAACLEGDPARYLRTGDLGFIDAANNLYITGRLKDLIIVAGKNHYPQDIEETVEQSSPVLRPHAIAAFALDDDKQESLIVLAEVQRRQVAIFDAKETAANIRRHISSHHNLALAEVIFLQRGQLPMTTSGKIQRKASRDMLLNDSYQILARIAF